MGRLNARQLSDRVRAGNIQNVVQVEGRWYREGSHLAPERDGLTRSTVQLGGWASEASRSVGRRSVGCGSGSGPR